VKKDQSSTDSSINDAGGPRTSEAAGKPAAAQISNAAQKLDAALPAWTPPASLACESP